QNWEKVTFFKQAHSLLIKERYDFFHPRTAIKAFARTIGKHQKNLRFNNIHLATDKINKQLIHQIHWDIESPNSPKKSIKHFVFDGILG
ncbi:hypothetical protein KJ654_02190, partial [Patescibacteria group bacterium]|nr:hypothetical protein [Patescibacteria group bacterium]